MTWPVTIIHVSRASRPLVGIYSLFVLGVGSAGPRYLWLMPIVVAGQFLVALVFAELGSHYPIAGALFQWAKNTVGAGYGWWVGWIYGWALIITVAAVDTGIYLYGAPLLNSIFGTTFSTTAPNTILGFTLVLLALQTIFNIVGVRLLGLISKIGTYVEIVGTFGIAALLAIVGFHHGFGFTFTTQGAQYASSNPLGVNFAGNWWLGAALVAGLAHVYIFYGFESAGDIAEEVRDPSRKVPRAITSSLLVGGITSFVLVLALLLAMPSGPKGYATAASFSGGVPYIISTNVSSTATSSCCWCASRSSAAAPRSRAPGARLVFSYARDGAVPGSSLLRRISPRFRTPVWALLVAAVIPALFALLVHFNPGNPIHFGFLTYPAHVNALAALVSFGVSGIYLAFMLVVIGALIARLRGWKPEGAFKLGRFAYPVIIGAIVYGGLMLINIVAPTGISSPKSVLFNNDWITLLVIVLIVVVGALFYFAAHPQRRVAAGADTQLAAEAAESSP